MTRLRLLAVLAALTLALGSVPAFAAEDDPSDTSTTTTTIPADEAPEEVDETADDTEASSTTNAKFLILLAEGFETSEDELTALTEMGFGWGEVFKLNLYATALGVDVTTLIDGAEVDAETGEYEFSWGELRAGLTAEQLTLVEDLPKNLGQMVSAAVRHQGRDAHQPDHAATGETTKPGKGTKPAHAGKGGKSGKGGVTTDTTVPEGGGETTDTTGAGTEG